MVSSHKSLKFEEVAADMRRLFGPRGGCNRQDVMTTEEAVRHLGSNEDLDACVLYKEARRRTVGQRRKAGAPKRRGDKVRGGGQTLSGINCRAVQRNRC